MIHFLFCDIRDWDISPYRELKKLVDDGVLYTLNFNDFDIYVDCIKGK